MFGGHDFVTQYHKWKEEFMQAVALLHQGAGAADMQRDWGKVREWDCLAAAASRSIGTLPGHCGISNAYDIRE